MNSYPLISIIIPVYNVEAYLTECLESLVNQTYTNLEIILINDGTKDNSAEICKLYAEKDKRIIFLEKENGGISSARNLGIDHANGEYISFVDSDDFIHHKYFEILVTNIENFDIIFCDSYKYYTDKPIESPVLSSFSIIEFTPKELLQQIWSFRIPLVIVPWAKLYKREIWNTLRYPVGRSHEDLAITPLYINNASKIKFIDIPLYYYRQNVVGSATYSTDIKKMKDYYLACQEQEIFFRSIGMLEEANKLSKMYKEHHIRKMMKMKDDSINPSFILNQNDLTFIKKIELVLKYLLTRISYTKKSSEK
ncbi:glycosyltransferase [Myroides pelagicus]|uniref:glycosyltransferase n=1 Tax=Myroides pelagicus TaxID=270914 RepID=UPI002DB7CB7F|nr:glycosyltransferase [Myroides pelagicus]MEC4115183.1 glycosyltransferase [Myroides pelagicus]